MRKTWLYSAIALVTAGTTLAVLLHDAPAEGGQPSATSASASSGSASTPAGASLGSPAPALSAAGAPATGQAAPASPAGSATEATLALWEPSSLKATKEDGLSVYHTRTSPEMLGALAVGRTLQLGVPGRQEPLRATLDETHNTGSTAVWSGPVEGGSEADTLTVVKGHLETHITLATTEQTLSFVVDNATGATQVTDQNELLMRATPDPIVTPDSKQLPPLPPPAQG